MLPSDQAISADAPDLAPYIDHSLLLPTATVEQVDHWCAEVDRYGFATVCVYPVHVCRAVENLHSKSARVCTVIGFPTGASTSSVKLYEAQEAVENGASELDVVINLGWLKAGWSDKIYREMAAICEVGESIKAILETSLLSDSELELAAEICMDAGVSFLKTSTGWHGGATIETVGKLQAITQGRVGIKASGGIRTAEQALALVFAGATRIGSSRGPDLVQQQQSLGVK